jgi:signal transduction histidine kinase
VTQHPTLTRGKPTGASDSSIRASRGGREGRLNPALVIGTLIFLSIGAFTLVFWYIASTTGLVNLSESAVYLVRSAGLAGLLIGAIGLFFVVNAFRRAALPIADIITGTDRVAAGEYDIEVGEQGPREIRALTRAFNAMADQLRTRDAVERRLYTEIARELVTSVNSLRQSMDVPTPAEDGRLIVAQDRAERLSRLIQDVHTLALARNGQLTLAAEATDLCVLVPDTISGLHRDASARGVALRADIPDPALFFVVDPKRFRQILKCLLVNALSRSAINTDIQIELSELKRPTQVQIKVTDHGTMIPPEELPFIFDHTGQASDIATGLELVVVNQLVRAQGGEVLATSTSDRGTSISVTLPPDTPRV